MDGDGVPSVGAGETEPMTGEPSVVGPGDGDPFGVTESVGAGDGFGDGDVFGDGDGSEVGVGVGVARGVGVGVGPGLLTATMVGALRPLSLRLLSDCVTSTDAAYLPGVLYAC